MALNLLQIIVPQITLGLLHIEHGSSIEWFINGIVIGIYASNSAWFIMMAYGLF